MLWWWIVFLHFFLPSCRFFNVVFHRILFDEHYSRSWSPLHLSHPFPVLNCLVLKHFHLKNSSFDQFWLLNLIFDLIKPEILTKIVFFSFKTKIMILPKQNFYRKIDFFQLKTKFWTNFDVTKWNVKLNINN